MHKSLKKYVLVLFSSFLKWTIFRKSQFLGSTFPGYPSNIWSLIFQYMDGYVYTFRKMLRWSIKTKGWFLFGGTRLDLRLRHSGHAPIFSKILEEGHWGEESRKSDYWGGGKPKNRKLLGAATPNAPVKSVPGVTYLKGALTNFDIWPNFCRRICRKIDIRTCFGQKWIVSIILPRRRCRKNFSVLFEKYVKKNAIKKVVWEFDKRPSWNFWKSIGGSKPGHSLQIFWILVFDLIPL